MLFSVEHKNKMFGIVAIFVGLVLISWENFYLETIFSLSPEAMMLFFLNVGQSQLDL